MQRRVLKALSLAVVVAGSPATSAAQRGRGPAAPKIVVATMHSTDHMLGVQMADELRSRIAGENSERDLQVQTKDNINAYLTASGYKTDSAVSVTDLKELAKGVNGNEFLDGTVSRSGTTIHLEVRFYLVVDMAFSQPLDPVNGKDIGEAAKLLEQELSAARKQVPDNQRCMNLLREGVGRTADAVRAAQESIRQYPRATMARTCLARVYIQAKYGPDSLLRVADEIIKLDPDNVFSWRLRAQAYLDKKDDANALAAEMKLQKLLPGDADVAANVIRLLVNSSNSADADKALPIIDELLAQSPGDPALLNTKWRLLQKLNRLKDAIPVGQMMVRSDTALADSTYYYRQMYAAMSDSNWAKAAEFGDAGGKKFTKDAEFPFVQGNALRKLNRPGEAAAAFRKTLVINPKQQNVRLLLAQSFLDAQMPDSVTPLAEAAIAAGDDKTTWGQFLIRPMNDAYKIADSSKNADDWQRSMNVAQHIDSIAPSAASKFFIGVSGLYIALDALQKAQPAKSCELARKAKDLFVVAQLAMPQGGSFNPQGAAAILSAIGQYSPTADQMIKAYCKP